jgi:lysophospholipase L1-like esterase
MTQMIMSNLRANAGQVIAVLVLTVVAICQLSFAQQVEPSPLPTQPAPSQPAPNPLPPTLFVIGDSTANNNANGGLGWADPFVNYFDATKLNVVNRARGGRSSRTFVTEGLWDKVLNEMKPGDFVLVQFGHNDGGPLDTGRARGSLPGTGEETKETTTPTGAKEVVHTYGWYLRKFIAEAKAKGAKPIVASLTVRNIWVDGKVERGSGKFGQWAMEVAKAESVSFMDLTKIIADQYEKLGQENVKELFAGDHTHTSPKGADLNAASVVMGLKTMNEIALVSYLAEKGKAVNATVSNQGPRPGARLPEPANPKLPTFFIIGDSTVRNGQGDGGSNGQWGWGEPIVAYFDTTKINVTNRALGGLSSRTYLTFGYWDRLLAMLKPGDIVIMQFGHNDSSPVNDNSRARGTIKGTGEEVEEIDNILTKQHEVVRSYGWYLRKFVADTVAKGATAIVCSPVPRKNWKDGKIVTNATDYAKWAADVASSSKVGFVDLNEIIARKYEALGPEKVEPLFADERTHTSLAGAELNAASVVAGLKALKKNPLARYFSEKGKAVKKAKLNTK